MTFFRDILMDHRFYNPSIESHSLFILQIILPMIHSGNGQPFLRIRPLVILIHFRHSGSQRNNHRGHILSFDLISQIQQIFSKTDHLGADVRIFFQPVNISDIPFMTGPDISAAAPLKTLVFDSLPGSLIGTGAVIKLIISIRNSYFSY